MKNALKFLIPVLLIVILAGCKKEKAAEPESLTDKDLTKCPSGANCKFYFADNAGMDGINLTLTTGQYRVFWANTSVNNISFSLYMMAPMLGDRFVLGEEDFKDGRVKFMNNCASCFSSGLTPVNGTIKGQRMPSVAGEKERWIIEADITLGTGNDIKFNTSIHLKQYYSPAN